MNPEQTQSFATLEEAIAAAKANGGQQMPQQPMPQVPGRMQQLQALQGMMANSPR